MNEFDLVYYRRSDGKRFEAKRTSNGTYTLLDPDTKERILITRYKLGKGYKCDRAVSLEVMKEKSRFKKRLRAA